MGTSYSMLYREDSNEYKVSSANCAAVSEPVENCKTYGANQVCQQCKDGYLLNTTTKLLCEKLDLPNCLKKKFTGDHVECVECASGYRL